MTSPTDLRIVRLSEETAALLDHVAPEVFDAAIDPGLLRDYLVAPGHVMLLAVLGGQVVGHVSAVIHHRPEKPRAMYVDEIGVTPAHQRKGIATALMAEVLGLAGSEGCAECWLGTDTANRPARALYSKLATDSETAVIYWFDTARDQIR
jgi:aminoglycoside 6'-N-acetyltransferase I